MSPFFLTARLSHDAAARHARRAAEYLPYFAATAYGAFYGQLNASILATIETLDFTKPL